MGRTNAIADALKKSKNVIVSDSELKKLGLNVGNVRLLVRDLNSQINSETEWCSDDETTDEEDESTSDEDDSSDEGSE